jgi:hypothetical protein
MDQGGGGKGGGWDRGGDDSQVSRQMTGRGRQSWLGTASFEFPN